MDVRVLAWSFNSLVDALILTYIVYAACNYLLGLEMPFFYLVAIFSVFYAAIFTLPALLPRPYALVNPRFVQVKLLVTGGLLLLISAFLLLTGNVEDAGILIAIAATANILSCTLALLLRRIGQ